MFFDHATINIKSGNGGNGCVSFRRAKYEPNGGPDGGNGGRGGDVVFYADANVNTLQEFRFKHNFAAADGANGMGKLMQGKSAENLRIRVPIGTLLFDTADDSLLADLDKAGKEVTILYGGKGGQGNACFSNSVRQAPQFATAGTTGSAMQIRLELRLLADVALVGFPNAGKSTLLSVISRARPKIADYPFTTIEPVLGVVTVDDTTFTVADVPGLIENAAQGAGMGHEFLRHVERARLLLHVVDASGLYDTEPLEAFHTINKELAAYKESLAAKPQWVVLNKIDAAAPEVLAKLQRTIEDEGFRVFKISAATTKGVAELKDALAAQIFNFPPASLPEESNIKVYKPKEKYVFTVTFRDGYFRVDGPYIRELMLSTNFSDTESARRFQKMIVVSGIEAELLRQGAVDGQTIILDGSYFEFSVSEKALGE